MSLIPIRVKRKWGGLSYGQAVTQPVFATCYDGLDYVLKTDSVQFPLVRATEYICCRIAEAVALPLPNFRVVEDTNHDFVFGSQIYGDIRRNAANQAQQIQLLTGNRPSAEIITQISRIYTYDLFVNNDDRHINNYVFEKQNQHDRVLSIDFSHSLFKTWPLPLGPMGANTNTVALRRLIEQHWGFDIAAARECAVAIARLRTPVVLGIVNSMPQGWLPQDRQNELLHWWGSGQKTRRAREIWAGLGNGTYL